MSLTIAPSPFGSLVVSVAETGSTLSVTTVATSPSVLTMALGVPGPAGATGATGAAGVGVPVGGSTSQALVKLSATDYSTTWAGPFLDSTGGTLSGTLFLPGLRNLLNTDLTVTAYNDTGAGTNFIHTFDAFDGTFALATNGGGLIFPDETVQTTAGLPLTGGTVSGNITISSFPEAPRFLTLSYDGLGVGGDQNSFELNEALGLTWYGGGDGYMGYKPDQIIFPDNSVQQTAFPPSGGLVTEYITGTGTLVTFPEVGDRYLTTSTTSLLIGNGTKTLTIGTGLSYTTQQDVTIAYDASNHMHATVTSYNSGTGVMVAQVHKHTGSGTFAAWTVNVGGVVGGLYLAIDNNLSELTATASTARTNLGLGTMSTEPASAYLSTASAVANYLTISSASSTYQTQSGMSAYLSTASAVANYLTISNAASTYLTQSSASSTYIAQASFATSTQAQAGTSTTTVVSPATLLDAKYFSGGKSAVQITWSAGSSGVGASAGAQNANGRLNAAPTTAVGYAIAGANLVNTSRGLAFGASVDFSKRVQFGLRVARNVASPDSASVWRYSIGKSIGVASAGDLSVRGLMIKVAGSGALQLLVHNGTSLTTTTSTYTPANSTAYDVVVVSDGAGNVTLYVNGSSVATSTGGPTSSSGGSPQLTFEVENTSIITGSPQNICISDYYLNVNV